MFNFLLNISTSTYFVFGASLVLTIFIVLIVLPLINRMKKMDDVLYEKMNLVPNKEDYKILLEEVRDHHDAQANFNNEYSEIKDLINELNTELEKINVKDFSNILLDTCDSKIGGLMDDVSVLDERITDFANYMHENEKQTSVQIKNLVAARIDAVIFLIKFIEKLKESNVIEYIDTDPLENIQRKLQKGLDSISGGGNYTVFNSNSKSGRVNRFTNDFKY